MNEIIGNIIIGIGLVFVLFGIIGLIKFKDFYRRILVNAKIDTMGVITIIIGVGVRHGFSFFTLKAGLMIILILFTNPIISHMIARSAYVSGQEPKNKQGENKI